MAKRNQGFGSAFALSLASAVIGGIAVYRHRAEIEKVVKDISAQLDAREEDGFFTADFGGDDVVHTVEHADAPAEEQTPEGEPPAADSEDFVDA